ncbi:MAG: hypothetical protein M1812_000867 [Candelaria pacifica]|nr:MAG: hypothetical protein M1812_000867 [Candelaria pacifica]
MLHEILLSLSGHPSPLLLSSAIETSQHKENAAFPLLSPPERALLTSIAHLGDVHQRLLHHTSLISSRHHSTVCRAVSSAIVSTHLARFQQKILEVERGIITKDAGRVGGYGIVPLSGVVGEFDEWTRRMEWFWDITRFMLPIGGLDSSKSDRKHKVAGKECTGAAIIDKLRNEGHTGYPDIELVASDLTKVAETAWLRQLSTWVLYGRLPSFGAEDFFIHSTPTVADGSRIPTFTIETELIPKYVTTQTTSSILFIGRSLNTLRARGTGLKHAGSTSSTSSELKLVTNHLRHLSALNLPISSSSLSSAIAAIRLSLSRNSLQQLLPLPRIVEILEILGEFFLLERGEFAVALITEAEKHIQSRHRLQGQPPRNQGNSTLGNVVVKEGEVTAVLTRTWASLALSQPEEDAADEKLDLARDLIRLSLSTSPNSSSSTQQNSQTNIPDTAFNDLLFSTPTTLSIHIPSPLDLFLTPTDLSQYTSINAYLLSIRRAHLRLTSLWKNTSLRREHPSLIPHHHTTAETHQQRRQRTNDRTRSMRKIWATSSAAVFLLAELGSYFQGEVVRGSWNTFRTWLLQEQILKPTSRPGSRPSSSTNLPPSPLSSSSSTHKNLDIWTSSSSPLLPLRPSRPPKPHHLTQSKEEIQNQNQQYHPHDPETLSKAHHQYLSSLSNSLLFKSLSFKKTLRGLLADLDLFVALIERLHGFRGDVENRDSFVGGQDLQIGKEESEVWRSLEEGRKSVERSVGELVERLRDIDQEGNSNWYARGAGEDKLDTEYDEETEEGGVGVGVGVGGGVGMEFVPWRGGGVDRLLMKLDFGNWRVGVGVGVGDGEGDGVN